MTTVVIELKIPTGINKIKWLVSDKTPVSMWIIGICTAFTHGIMSIVLPQFMEVAITNNFGGNYDPAWTAQLISYLGWYNLAWDILAIWVAVIFIEYIIRIILWARVKYRARKSSPDAAVSEA